MLNRKNCWENNLKSVIQSLILTDSLSTNWVSNCIKSNLKTSCNTTKIRIYYLSPCWKIKNSCYYTYYTIN